MGSAVSLAGTMQSRQSGTDRIFASMNESRLVHIVMCTESDSKCNMVECMVGLQYGTSLVSKPEKMTSISGYSWMLDDVLRPDDAKRTIHSLEHFSNAQQVCITDICRHPGLLHHYEERYPRPRTLPDNTVYVRMMFEVTTGNSQNTLAVTYLSGCVDKSDLDFTLEETSTVLGQMSSRDPYAEYTEQVLPGDRIKPFRLSFERWWARVLRALHSSAHTRCLAAHRESFYMHINKQSVSYLAFLETERAKCQEDVEHHEQRALEAGMSMVQAYVDSICDEVEAVAQLFFNRSSKACTERLTELRRSFLNNHMADVQNAVRVMQVREKEAWALYEQQLQLESDSQLDGQHHRQTRSSSANTSRRSSGFGRSVTFVDPIKDSSGQPCPSSGTNSRRPSTASPTRKVNPSVLSSPINEDQLLDESCEAERFSSYSPGKLASTVSSRNRKSSIAPLDQPLQAWSAPTPVEISTATVNRRKSIATVDTTINKAMVPCERKNNLIRALANAKQKDLSQMEEDLLCGCVLELKLSLYELAMVEQMENYMVRELALLEEITAKKKEAKLTELRRRHAKEKGKSIAQQWSQDDIDSLLTRQNGQVEKLIARCSEVNRRRKVRFHESRLKTTDVLMGKLASLRRRYKNSPLSDVGLEKLKCVCLVYQALREGE